MAKKECAILIYVNNMESKVIKKKHSKNDMLLVPEI